MKGNHKGILLRNTPAGRLNKRGLIMNEVLGFISLMFLLIFIGAMVYLVSTAFGINIFDYLSSGIGYIGDAVNLTKEGATVIVTGGGLS